MTERAVVANAFGALNKTKKKPKPTDKKNQSFQSNSASASLAAQHGDNGAGSASFTRSFGAAVTSWADDEDDFTTFNKNTASNGNDKADSNAAYLNFSPTQNDGNVDDGFTSVPVTNKTKGKGGFQINQVNQTLQSTKQVDEIKKKVSKKHEEEFAEESDNEEEEEEEASTSDEEEAEEEESISEQKDANIERELKGKENKSITENNNQAQQAQLSKKEQKKKELAELDALLNDLNVNSSEKYKKNEVSKKSEHGVGIKEGQNINGHGQTTPTDVEKAAEAALADLLASSASGNNAESQQKKKKKNKTKNKKKQAGNEGSETVGAGNNNTLGVEAAKEALAKKKAVKKNAQGNNALSEAEAELKARAQALRNLKKKDKSTFNQIPNHLA